ncbi:MAG: ABC transporter permease [Limisphaerales bacterium]
MTLLPVVQRELRAAARERNSYRVRFLAAMLTVMFSVFSLWFIRFAFNETPIPPRTLFLFLTWIAYVFVCIAGFSLTCDSISQEKRDATLGLLFLTDLKGYDVVLGKLCIAVLQGVYALIATFPVLALPLMMGGTNLTELARTTGTLVVALVFSMAVGIAVSSMMRRSWGAFGVSGAILFVFALLLPSWSGFVREFYRDAQLAHWFELPSPSYAMSMSFRNAIGLTGNDFGYSLGILLLLTVAAVLMAALTTPHVWKDRPPTRRFATFLEFFRTLKLGSAEFRKQFRRRLLDLNPIFWLSRRERVSSGMLLLMLCIIGMLAGWVGRKNWSAIGPQANEIFPRLAWFATAALAHSLIMLRLAVLAAERFGDDRRSGALELILSTPISIKTVLSGHWRGLRRAFAGPALLAFGFQTMALCYLLIPDRPEDARTFSQIVADVFWHLKGFPLRPNWEYHFIVLVILSLFPLFLLDWTAIAWLSTWRSLRLKHSIFAPISALIILHLPTPIAFGFIAGYLQKHRLLPDHDFSETLVLFAIAAGLTASLHLLCIFWSRRQLYKHFRTAATDRYQPAPKRRWWQGRIA